MCKLKTGLYRKKKNLVTFLGITKKVEKEISSVVNVKCSLVLLVPVTYILNLYFECGIKIKN